MRLYKFTVGRLILLSIALIQLPHLQAQEECEEDCKLNTNFAIIINAPVGSSAQVVGTGWGMVGGAGYNFNQRHAMIGEFLWNRVYPSRGALQPLQAALQSQTLKANTDFYALTADTGSNCEAD